MRRLIYVALLASCGGPERRTSPTRDVVKRWVVEPNGELAVTTAGDGSITARSGDSTHAMRLAADGTFDTFSTSTGGKVVESFTRDGPRVRWTSEHEAGDATVQHTAMFVPVTATPHVLGVVARAAIRAGGTLPLLPAGSAIVTRVAEHAIVLAGATHHLHCYAIEGLDVVPAYTWMASDGSWFGSVDPGATVVPTGWEAAVVPLRDKQAAAERTRLRALAGHGRRPRPAGVAYVHARVFDPERRVWLPDHTVVVTGDTIAAVGPSSSTPIPNHAEIVDLSGKAVIPGLIDMHAHLHAAGGLLAIASGVTTVRDLGNHADVLDQLARAFDAGDAIGPHVVRWGRIDGRGPDSPSGGITVTTVDEATAAVRDYARRGYRGIKIYGGVPVELVAPIVTLAHDLGLPVTGHVPAFMLADDALAAGFDGLEHANMLMLNFLATRQTDTRGLARFTLVGDRGATIDLASPRVRDFVAKLAQKRVVVDPTLVVLERIFAPGPRDQVARMPLALQRRHARSRVQIAAGAHASYRGAWQRMLELAKLLHDAGVHVAIGSDSTAGLMLHRELELFAAAGIDNAHVLALATLGNARALKLDATIGSITTGKRADLVILDGDPLADIREIKNVVATVRAGVSYPSAPLYAGVAVR